MTQEELRKKILDALPMKTALETAWYWHLKDQPAEFWQALHASYDPAPAAPGRSKAQP
jgi:hypothetical protein